MSHEPYENEKVHKFAAILVHKWLPVLITLVKAIQLVQKILSLPKKEIALYRSKCVGPVMLFWELGMLTGPKKDDCT